MNELEIKVGEVIALLDKLTNQAAFAVKSKIQAEETRNGLLADIEVLEPKLASLKDEHGKEQQIIREKQSELDQMKSRVKSTLESAETQAQVATTLQAKAAQDSLEASKIKEEYAQKNSELTKRENAVEALNLQLHKEVSAFEERLKTCNIEEREKQVSTLIDKARSIREEARKAQESADEEMAKVNDTKAQLIKTAESNTVLKARLESRLRETEEKERSLDAEKVAVAKQKADVETQQLRLNKIIKEKNIEEALIKP